MSPKIGSFKLNKWTLKFEFRKSEKNPSQGFVYRWYIENFRHLSWNLSLGETGPFFWQFRRFFSIFRVRANFECHLKVTLIDFRKSAKILPRERSKGDILKYLDIYLKNWAQDRMPRFVVFGAFFGHFSKFFGVKKG